MVIIEAISSHMDLWVFALLHRILFSLYYVKFSKERLTQLYAWWQFANKKVNGELKDGRENGEQFNNFFLRTYKIVEYRIILI